IDPFSGYPVNNGVISVAIVGQDAAAADAYSTAVMVMGLDKGYGFMQENDLKGVIITENGYKASGIELTEVYNAYQLIS
ncbi:MAG: FAD:protein FMN transferase, partial [Clostridia bacterium]|nr:FAD:protein FMN transferase [Clostridia bacterium]